ncbi:hypothetical protein GCM10010166_36920 [Couchioplanes caeruleus subsp. azureus]|nr:hypothetical protein GCM10010166_36920 [Couchioplanes caeruleus subsp. azureus]
MAGSNGGGVGSAAGAYAGAGSASDGGGNDGASPARASAGGKAGADAYGENDEAGGGAAGVAVGSGGRVVEAEAEAGGAGFGGMATVACWTAVAGRPRGDAPGPPRVAAIRPELSARPAAATTSAAARPAVHGRGSPQTGQMVMPSCGPRPPACAWTISHAVRASTLSGLTYFVPTKAMPFPPP